MLHCARLNFNLLYKLEESKSSLTAWSPWSRGLLNPRRQIPAFSNSVLCTSFPCVKLQLIDSGRHLQIKSFARRPVNNDLTWKYKGFILQSPTVLPSLKVCQHFYYKFSFWKIYNWAIKVFLGGGGGPDFPRVSWSEILPPFLWNMFL